MKTIVDLDPEPVRDYFHLMEKVGTKGNYQNNVFLILLINWFVAAFLLMGTSFLYLTPSLSCELESYDQCSERICKLPPEEWKEHLEPKLIESLSTEFGPYVCSKVWVLNFLRSTLYVGVLCGYMIFLFLADNYGRKVSLIITWSVTTFGIALLALSWNMTLASIGLFFAGAGCESSLRISMSYLTEMLDFDLRQKYSVGLQSTFGIVGMLIGLTFWFFQQWRVIIIIFCLMPSILVLYLFTYLEETPRFLIRKGALNTERALNRIAFINGIQQEKYVNYEDLLPYLRKIQEEEEHSEKGLVTPIDLFTYKSLRVKTIASCAIFFFITYIYLGPIVIVDQLGINPFVSQIIVSFSELIAYPLVYYIINQTARKQSGELLFLISAFFTFLLIFIQKPSDCHSCWQGIIELIFIFCSRFCISVYFSIFFVYVPELYPSTARGMGFGFASASGAIASASSQIILPYFQQKGFSPMIIFTIMALGGAFALKFLPETKDAPLEEEIEEIEMQKNGQDWSIAKNLKTQTDFMVKTAKSQYNEFLTFLFPRLAGFTQVSNNEES